MTFMERKGIEMRLQDLMSKYPNQINAQMVAKLEQYYMIGNIPYEVADKELYHLFQTENVGSYLQEKGFTPQGKMEVAPKMENPIEEEAIQMEEDRPKELILTNPNQSGYVSPLTILLLMGVTGASTITLALSIMHLV